MSMHQSPEDSCLTLTVIPALSRRCITDLAIDLPVWFLSRAKRATTQHPENIRTINPSPQNPALKRSYSQVVQTRKPTRDPEKQARDRGKASPDQSRDPSALSTSRDPTRSHDHTGSRGIT